MDVRIPGSFEKTVHPWARIGAGEPKPRPQKSQAMVLLCSIGSVQRITHRLTAEAVGATGAKRTTARYMEGEWRNWESQATSIALTGINSRPRVLRRTAGS